MEVSNETKDLADYAYFVAALRRCREQKISLKTAVELTVEECIEQDILRDFLLKNRNEVMRVLLTEYDMKKHIRLERRDAFEEGEEKGREDGILIGEARGVLIGHTEGEYVKLISLIRKKLVKSIPPEDCAELLEEDVKLVTEIYRLMKEYPGKDDEAIYRMYTASIK
ncbi:MAG: hypothetical protein PHR92_03455 [Lachnospiraceae bacterium]|nr:hypothetical protein [Lachnospiraceae bacterium]